jgi:hypothetical protein
VPYREQREFSLHLELSCEFPDDYAGEADGYEWLQELPALTREMVQAVVAVVAKHDSWRVRPGNRGRSSEDEVCLLLERVLREGE